MTWREKLTKLGLNWRSSIDDPCSPPKLQLPLRNRSRPPQTKTDTVEASAPTIAAVGANGTGKSPRARSGHINMPSSEKSTAKTFFKKNKNSSRARKFSTSSKSAPNQSQISYRNLYRPPPALANTSELAEPAWLPSCAGYKKVNKLANIEAKKWSGGIRVERQRKRIL